MKKTLYDIEYITVFMHEKSPLENGYLYNMKANTAQQIGSVMEKETKIETLEKAKSIFKKYNSELIRKNDRWILTEYYLVANNYEYDESIQEWEYSEQKEVIEISSL